MRPRVTHWIMLGLATHYAPKGITTCGTAAPPARRTDDVGKVSCARCWRSMRKKRKALSPKSTS